MRRITVRSGYTDAMRRARFHDTIGRFLASFVVSLGMFSTIDPMLRLGEVATRCLLDTAHAQVCWRCVAEDVEAIVNPYCPTHNPEAGE